MGDIAALVFGGDPEQERDGRDQRGPRPDGGCLGPNVRPEQWCATPPGDAAVSWLAASLLGREPKPRRDRGGRRDRRGR
jgi:hypothetical protein